MLSLQICLLLLHNAMRELSSWFIMFAWRPVFFIRIITTYCLFLFYHIWMELQSRVLYRLILAVIWMFRTRHVHALVVNLNVTIWLLPCFMPTRTVASTDAECQWIKKKTRQEIK